MRLSIKPPDVLYLQFLMKIKKRVRRSGQAIWKATTSTRCILQHVDFDSEVESFTSELNEPLSKKINSGKKKGGANRKMLRHEKRIPKTQIFPETKLEREE